MHILFPALLRFSDVGLLLLRLMVAVVFLDSGWNHLQNPVERSKSIGASPRFTMFLGAAGCTCRPRSSRRRTKRARYRSCSVGPPTACPTDRFRPCRRA